MERIGKSRRGGNAAQEKNIEVVIRCRPRSLAETRANSPCVVHCHGNRGEILVKQKEAGGTKAFAFDKVFGPDSTQIMVYKEVVCPIIKEVLQGYNCTVFAYGQTGTGKTYTMEGGRSADGSISWEDDPMAGIIPRSLHQLFEMLEKHNVEYSVRISYLELYNEELFDLLSVGMDNSKLRIFEDSTRRGSVVIQGLEELVVNDKNEVYSILERGANRRKTAATLLNACSSRSHSVFSVTIHMKENSIDGEEMLKTGKLNLVDLAGSENIGRSGAVDKRAREAGSINQSLLTLGRVITALVERGPHIPYRESKLTRILQDSLGGRTKTSIIATISPSQCNIEETLSTLDYANRAKNITNRPEINQKLSKKALIKEYTEEIERLKKDLYASREKNGIFLSSDNFTGMENKISSQKTTIKELENKICATIEEMRKLNDLFVENQRVLVERNDQLQETSENLASTEVALAVTRQDLTTITRQKEEEKFLFDEHIKFEKVVCHEAEQLLGVVHETISDVDGLHSKLERKLSVENRNLSAASMFHSRFQCDLDALQSSMTSYSQSQQLTCKDFSNKIESWAGDASRELGFIKNTLGFMMTCIGNFSMTEQATSQKNTDDVTKDISRIESSSCAFKENIVSQTSAMMADFLCPQLQHLSDLISKHQGNMEEATHLHKAQLATQWESASEFVNKQRMLLSSLSSRLDDQNTRQSSEAVCHQQDLKKIILDQLCSTQKMKRDWQAVLDQQQEALDQHQTQLTNALRQVSDNSQIALESRQADTDSLQKSLHSLSCEMKQCSNASNSALRETATSMDAMLVQHGNVVKLEEKTVSDVKKSLVESVGIVNQSTKKEMEDMSTLCAAVSSRLAINTDQQVHSWQLHSDGVSLDCAKLQGSLDNLVDQRVETAATQWTEEVNTVMDSVDEIVGNQEKLRTEACSTLDRYISKEMKLDIPTGNTPLRRDFDYPPHLTKIREHSELLEERGASNNLHIQTLPNLSGSDEEWCATSTSTISAEESVISVPALNLDCDVTMDPTVTTQSDGSLCTVDGCSPIYMDKENSEFTISKLPNSNSSKKIYSSLKMNKSSGSSGYFTKKIQVSSTKKTLASSTKKPLVSTSKKPPIINKN